MKIENGHESAEFPLQGLSSQIASAVGELLRTQQELEAREKAADQREQDVAQSAQALEARAAEVERTERSLRDRVSALDAREMQLAAREAQAESLTEREQRQRDQETALQYREHEITRREAQLVDVSAEAARLAERERAIASERAACEEGATALARHEAEIEARSTKLEQRERAFETVCEMLRSMTTALNEPTPDNISAALDATSKAKEARPELALPTAAPTPILTPVEKPVPVDSAEAGSAAADEINVDMSDLSTEERHRVRMLQQLGTASLAEILAAIREERSAFASETPRRKRRLGFLK